MTSWRGVLQGLQMYEQAQSEEKARQFQREQFEFNQQQAQEALNLRRQEMAIRLLPQLRANAISSSALASAGSRLQAYFGEESPVVDRLLASGNVDAINAVLSNIDEQYEVASEEGRGDEYIEMVRLQLENEAEITPAGSADIDVAALERILGGTLEDMNFPISTSVPIPGAVSVRPTVYRPIATLEELNRAEERIAQSAVDQGRDELTRLRAASASITESLEDSNLDPNRQTSLREDLIVIGDRMRMIEEAIDNTTGDSPSFFDILGLYGNNATERVIASSRTRISVEDLTPTFTQNIDSAPLVVASPEQAQRFFELGIITEEDRITYNGITYPVSMLFSED